MKNFSVLFILLACLASCKQNLNERRLLGRTHAAESLKNALQDTSTSSFGVKQLIPDNETAVKLAEVILFKKYGESTIKNERPYEVYNIDGYWIIRGTMPVDEDQRGGTFEIIIESNNGKVMKLVHYK